MIEPETGTIRSIKCWIFIIKDDGERTQGDAVVSSEPELTTAPEWCVQMTANRLQWLP